MESVAQASSQIVNVSLVPEVKLMGVELIGVNKLGLINWSQLIGVN